MKKLEGIKQMNSRLKEKGKLARVGQAGNAQKSQPSFEGRAEVFNEIDLNSKRANGSISNAGASRDMFYIPTATSTSFLGKPAHASGPAHVSAFDSYHPANFSHIPPSS
jgi:hypothetical protein